MTSSEWPKTLPEWRNRCFKPEDSWPYDLWKPEPLQNFFREHGYHLWVTMHDRGLGDDHHHHLALIPPNEEPRRPDGYTFVTCYQCEPGIIIHRPNFIQLRNIHCAVRTIHNQDVLIRLISINGDATGDEHYKAIRRLSQGQTAYRGDNYALPLLNELEFNGLRFVVFPLLSIGYIPWFYNVDEILDYLVQVFKGVKFCHDNLIAHLDLDSDNILFNFLGARTMLTGIRNLMPLVHFDLISLSDTISTISKPQFVSMRTQILGVGKLLAYPPTDWVQLKDTIVGNTPEMLTGDPYCPFKADVWYLGRMLHRNMEEAVKGFVEKHLKSLRDDFSFDDVFGKSFTQDAIQSEDIIHIFDEFTGKINVDQSFPKDTLKMALSLLTTIAQMGSSNLDLRPSLSQLLDSVVEMRRNCPPAVLSDYIGTERKAVVGEMVDLSGL
ncbi:uncharacterized protein ARMOST_17356 [Armillaria ostoyae]|uniref:Protein kinase domain-containing protein n=1 Tax=Armillaria ostoyae TaxID=47428 RepID=A0A284RYY0_ARMOS|nr:uncharacterized protein ARMOST_17356 [Armillaria ostoyae]